MKNTSIFIKTVLLAISILFVMGCSKNDDDIYYRLAGNWKVLYYIENGQKITKLEKPTWPEDNNGEITANFTIPDNNGKGTISGVRVTNSYNGNYTVQRNGKISFGPLSQTYIGEPDWTELYNIRLAENYEVNNLILLMYYNNNKSVIVLGKN
ncbi:MAG TPA: hypothetical protein PK076_03500 [Saprospiraceae bacterium]|nr:hypothetical protein [Saprospiraceae bacterium]HQW55160.1 hypothetical protein [Saprospiraceae bacterium]